MRTRPNLLEEQFCQISFRADKAFFEERRPNTQQEQEEQQQDE